MGHLVGIAQLLNRRSRIAAADNGYRIGIGRHRFGNGAGAVGKSRKLRNAHGTVPDNRLCRFDNIGINGASLRPDVHSFVAVRDLRALNGFLGSIGADFLHNHAIHRKQQLNALLLGLFHQFSRKLNLVLLHNACAGIQPH